MLFYGSPNTIRVQKSLFNRHIQPICSRDRLNDLTNEDVINMVIRWEEIPLSSNTIRSLLALLRRYYKIETKKVLPEDIPIRLLPTDSKPKALNKDQVRRLLKDIKNNENHNVYLACMLAYHAGLRKGEVFGLKWNSIDFARGELIITNSYDGPTKSRKPRKVPMSTILQLLLLEESMVSGDNAKVIRPFNPGPILQKACKRAIIPRITFHAFRHTFATLALDSGKSVKEVQEMLGHSKASTTIDIYWNNIKSDMKVDFT